VSPKFRCRVSAEDQRKVAMEFLKKPPNVFWNCRIGALEQINGLLGGKSVPWPFHRDFGWNRHLDRRNRNVGGNPACLYRNQGEMTERGSFGSFHTDFCQSMSLPTFLYFSAPDLAVEIRNKSEETPASHALTGFAHTVAPSLVWPTQARCGAFKRAA